MKKLAALVLCVIFAATTFAQDLPPTLPRLDFHLTARPWQPLNAPRDASLGVIEGLCRFTAKHQDQKGAVIDPFLKREHQYSTPYFAFAVGTLLHAGRAADLRDNGIRAMEHATACFARGYGGIPDQHGEFFIPALAGALELYKDHVPPQTFETWRDRLKISVDKVVGANHTNNWRAYAMRGQWMRFKLGLVDRDRAASFIEDGWTNVTQRDRIAGDKWNLYQDRQTDPESGAVEGVGRVNLLGLVAAGYDGKSAADIRAAVERGTQMSPLLQEPSGQCPPNGRADDHVWNDVLYHLAFTVMAERAAAANENALAGQYRRAASLAYNSIHRWRRADGEWAGSFYVTKNHFDPAMRVGYQPASNYGNYNGALMIHLAEAYLARTTDIPEQPAPSEIGGYAFALDPKFAAAVANAGGMHLHAALRGDTRKTYDMYWTSLGVNRFGRAGWDSRLGPSDGHREPAGRGVSFAPTWLEDGKWVRLADIPERYRGKFSVQFAHPLLVRCAIDYASYKGAGPTFRHEFMIIPDGVLATCRATGTTDFGVTWPLLKDDGRPLRTTMTENLATTTYAEDADQQSFLALNPGPKVEPDGQPLRSTYGYLQPLRALASQNVQHTFIYPRNASDPAAAEVSKNFRQTNDGFESPLAVVTATTYVGRTSAGGEGTSIDLDLDGKADVTFDHPCRFVLQLREGKVTAIESDQPVTATLAGKSLPLKPYVPQTIER
jgi:hypothetical protein